MIIVNCKDVPSLKSPLAIFSSDQVGAIPALKLHEFALAPIEDEEIDADRVIKAIRAFLVSIDVDKHFAVIRNKNLISIIPVDDFKLESPTGPTDQFFSCIHCGHVTQFETIHNTHMKIHYL